MLYYSKHLKATHRKHLINDNPEAAGIQVR